MTKPSSNRHDPLFKPVHFSLGHDPNCLNYCSVNVLMWLTQIPASLGPFDQMDLLDWSSCFFLGLKLIIYSSVFNVCCHSRLCFLNGQCIDCSVLPIFLSINARTLMVKGEEKSNNRSIVTYCCRLPISNQVDPLLQLPRDMWKDCVVALLIKNELI